MPSPDDRSGTSPARWDRRGALLAVAALELIIAIVAYAGPAWLVVVYQLLSDGMWLVAWLLGAVGWGLLVLAPLRRVDADGGQGLLGVITATAAGLGLMSLSTLGLGLAAWLNRGIAIALVAGGLACGAALVWRRNAAVLRGDLGTPLKHSLSQAAGWHWLCLAAIPLLAIAVVGAFVPPGMLWTPDEPHGYDVVEYHFQVPREWYETERIVPLRHNVFSYFPFGMEMHYLLAMHLRGGPWKGMYLAQLMHVAHVVLTVVAVYGLAARITQRRATAIASALSAAAVPWLTLLAPVGYNEGALLLYGTLAIGWSVLAMNAPPRVALARFALAGVMVGFACGVKLTAVPMLLAAVPVAVVVASPRLWRYAWVFVITGSVLFAPWAIRNLVWTGNPVLPEAAGLFGSGHFSATQIKRWENAHSPRPDQRSLAARLSAGGREFVMNWRFGYGLPLAVGLSGAGYAFRDRRARALYGLFLLLLIFWHGFTHLQGRFLVLAVPITALLIAVTDWGRIAAMVPAIVVASLAVGWFTVHEQFNVRLHGRQPLAGVLGLDDFADLHPPEVKSLPPGSTLVLIGEAKAFLYQHPMRMLRYRTVFDVDVPASDSVIDAWRGGPQGPGEWDLIHPSELQRFADTYYGIPPPPPGLKGRTDVIVVPPPR